MKNLVMLVTLGVLAIGANGETNSTANGIAPTRSGKRMFTSLPHRIVMGTNQTSRTPSLEQARRIYAIGCELKSSRERRLQTQLSQEPQVEQDDLEEMLEVQRKLIKHTIAPCPTITTRADVVHRLKDLVGEELGQQPSSSSNKLVLAKPIGVFSSGFTVLGGGRIKSMRFTYEPPKDLSDTESEKVAYESCTKFLSELGLQLELQGVYRSPTGRRSLPGGTRSKSFENIRFSMTGETHNPKRIFTFAIDDESLNRKLADQWTQLRKNAWHGFVDDVQRFLKPIDDEDSKCQKGWVDAELQEPFFKFSKVRLGYVNNEIAVVLFCFYSDNSDWAKGKGEIFKRFNLPEKYANRMYFNCSLDTRIGEYGAVAVSNYDYDKYGLVSD